MSHVVLIALIVFGVLVVSGLAVAGIRGLAFWRALKGFQRNTLTQLTEASDRLAALEERTARAAEAAKRLDQARVRLQQTLSVLGVVNGAAQEAMGLAGRVRGIVPRK